MFPSPSVKFIPGKGIIVTVLLFTFVIYIRTRHVLFPGDICHGPRPLALPPSTDSGISRDSFPFQHPS